MYQWYKENEDMVTDIFSYVLIFITVVFSFTLFLGDFGNRKDEPFIQTAYAADDITKEIEANLQPMKLTREDLDYDMYYRDSSPVYLFEKRYLVKEDAEEPAEAVPELNEMICSGPDAESKVRIWNGSVLTASMGVNWYGDQKETWYNLNMDGVISIMRDLGYSESDYPYWIREDGVKMLGDFVMCAANLDIYPRGSFVPTSLGLAIVCDTGTFVYNEPLQVDIAVNW